MTQRILVVEDNTALADGLRYNLELEGFAVSVAGDGPTAVAMARELRPHLVILDLMLPGLDGFQVLQRIRATGDRVPVLILSARGEETDKVRGFRLGADDYVTKPFGLLELLARVEALLRRTGPGGAKAEQEGEAFRFGDVVVDNVRQQVTRAGIPVQLTHREYTLLLSLLRRKGAVVSRIDLLKEVWGYRGAVNSRTIDTHIMELRRKLEIDPSQPRHILTIRKSGYRLQA